MKWRCMLPEQFKDVEAETERAAQVKAILQWLRELTEDNVIAWETEAASGHAGGTCRCGKCPPSSPDPDPLF